MFAGPTVCDWHHMLYWHSTRGDGGAMTLETRVSIPLDQLVSCLNSGQ